MAEPGVSAKTAKNAMSSGHFSDDFDCLVFEDVSRYFGRMRALSHVSFSPLFLLKISILNFLSKI